MSSSDRRALEAIADALTRQGAALSYTRFIPKEELQDFTAWRPGAFADEPAQRVDRGGPISDFGGVQRPPLSQQTLLPDFGHGAAGGALPDLASLAAAAHAAGLLDAQGLAEMQALPPGPAAERRAANRSLAAPATPRTAGSPEPAPRQGSAQTPVRATAQDAAEHARQQARQEAEAEAAAQAAQREQALREQLQADHDQRLAEAIATQVQEARQQGYQDGYRDGLVALDSFKESYARQTSAQIGALVTALDAELGAMEQQLAASVARIATELARQVVRSELALRPALVTQVAQEAMDAVLVSARHITVHLHPDDHTLVAQGCDEVLAARGARLLASPNIARGGCKVESDAGTIDACLPARWAQATQALGSGVGWSDDDLPGADA